MNENTEYNNEYKQSLELKAEYRIIQLNTQYTNTIEYDQITKSNTVEYDQI